MTDSDADDPASDALFLPLADKAVDELQRRILSGELAPGTHLQEKVLSEWLGMSRTPVREALRRLAHQDLLVIGPKRGWRVRRFTGEQIHNAFEVRASLEGTACRLVAEKGISPESAAALKQCVDRGFAVTARSGQGIEDRISTWMTMNADFHRIIIQETNNAMLSSMVQDAQRLPLTNHQHTHRYHVQKNYSEFIDAAARHHAAIYDAIRGRQSYRAEAAMREHIWASAELFQGYDDGMALIPPE